MWLQRQRTGDYVLDNLRDERLLDYDDLFREWEKVLQFVIGGRDAAASGARRKGAGTAEDGA